MLIKINNFIKNTMGNATIEFTLVFPILLSLIAAGVDYGQSYYLKHAITTECRNGARYAAINFKITNCVVDNINTYVKNNIKTDLSLPETKITVVSTIDNTKKSIKVDATYEYDYLILGAAWQVLLMFIDSGGTAPKKLNINTSASMTFEG